MPLDHGFDGPRLIRPAERRASHRLSCLCFGGNPDAVLSEDEGPGETYVIAAEGQPVSQIDIFQTQLKVYDGVMQVGSIGGVCTHPDFRGKELASRLLKFCTDQLAAGGAKLLLISGGRGLYTRSGCVPAGKHASFILSPAGLREPDGNISLRRAVQSDASFASRLYQSEPVHFERDWEMVAGHIAHHGQAGWMEDWIVEMDGQPAAYFVITTPWDNTPEDGFRLVHEYSGSRMALAGGLWKIIEQCAIKQMDISVAWQDTDLIALLQQTGLVPEWITLPEHTMRILDLPGLMQDLLPNLRARLAPALLEGLRFEQSGPLLEGQGEGGFIISLGDERLELDGLAMTRLVMGSMEEIPVSAGRLSEVLTALFPLPSFLPGMDYH